MFLGRYYCFACPLYGRNKQRIAQAVLDALVNHFRDRSAALEEMIEATNRSSATPTSSPFQAVTMRQFWHMLYKCVNSFTSHKYGMKAFGELMMELSGPCAIFAGSVWVRMWSEKGIHLPLFREVGGQRVVRHPPL